MEEISHLWKEGHFSLPMITITSLIFQKMMLCQTSCVFVCVSVCDSLCECASVHMCLFKPLCVCLYVPLCVYMSVWASLCVYVCMRVCVCTSVSLNVWVCVRMPMDLPEAEATGSYELPSQLSLTTWFFSMHLQTRNSQAWKCQPFGLTSHKSLASFAD